MSQQIRQPLGLHFVDAGPLLCLGGSQKLAAVFDESFLPNSLVVEAVANEIDDHARRRDPPGDPKRQKHITAAAQVDLTRYKSLLAANRPRPTPTPDHLASVEARLRELAVEKAERRGKTREIGPTENRGEAESIHASLQESATLITCDNDAHRVAREEGVSTETFVDVAKRIAALPDSLRPKQVLQELQQLTKQGFDVGDVVTSVLDLR